MHFPAENHLELFWMGLKIQFFLGGNFGSRSAVVKETLHTESQQSLQSSAALCSHRVSLG